MSDYKPGAFRTPSRNGYSEVEKYLSTSPRLDHPPEKQRFIIWNQYQLGEQLGSGSFGQVFRCKCVKTGKEFAVKKFRKKFTSKKRAFDVREIKILKRFQEMHDKGQRSPYVMKAEMIEYENRNLYIVFPKMEMTLTQYIKKIGRKNLIRLDEEEQIKTIMKQVFNGLQYLHKELGVMHRDLKPDNIMINERPLHARIIDFGTCKDLTTETAPHTSYVSTRWYRSPECLLRSHHYTTASDMFAAGCIMGELYLQNPLFPGTTELDQLEKILKLLGTPRRDQWKEGYRLAEGRELKIQDFPKKSLQSHFPGISEQGADLLRQLLAIPSGRRVSASQALNQAFFLQLVTPSTDDTTNIIFTKDYVTPKKKADAQFLSPKASAANSQFKSKERPSDIKRFNQKLDAKHDAQEKTRPSLKASPKLLPKQEATKTGPSMEKKADARDGEDAKETMGDSKKPFHGHSKSELLPKVTAPKKNLELTTSPELKDLDIKRKKIAGLSKYSSKESTPDKSQSAVVAPKKDPPQLVLPQIKDARGPSVFSPPILSPSSHLIHGPEKDQPLSIIPEKSDKAGRLPSRTSTIRKSLNSSNLPKFNSQAPSRMSRASKVSTMPQQIFPSRQAADGPPRIFSPMKMQQNRDRTFDSPPHLSDIIAGDIGLSSQASPLAVPTGTSPFGGTNIWKSGITSVKKEQPRGLPRRLEQLKTTTGERDIEQVSISINKNILATSKAPKKDRELSPIFKPDVLMRTTLKHHVEFSRDTEENERTIQSPAREPQSITEEPVDSQARMSSLEQKNPSLVSVRKSIFRSKKQSSMNSINTQNMDYGDQVVCNDQGVGFRLKRNSSSISKKSGDPSPNLARGRRAKHNPLNPLQIVPSKATLEVDLRGDPMDQKTRNPELNHRISSTISEILGTPQGDIRVKKQFGGNQLLLQ